MLEPYVRVLGDDYARFGDRADELAVFIGNRAYLRMVDGHCLSLRIEPETGRFVCSVYDLRPEECRALERGSPQCRGEIFTKGDRPGAALRRMGRTSTDGSP